MTPHEQQLTNLSDTERTDAIDEILVVADQVDAIFDHGDDADDIVERTKTLRLNLLDKLGKIGISATTKVEGREVNLNWESNPTDIGIGFNSLVSAAKKLKSSAEK